MRKIQGDRKRGGKWWWPLLALSLREHQRGRHSGGKGGTGGEERKKEGAKVTPCGSSAKRGRELGIGAIYRMEKNLTRGGRKASAEALLSGRFSGGKKKKKRGGGELGRGGNNSDFPKYTLDLDVIVHKGRTTGRKGRGKHLSDILPYEQQNRRRCAYGEMRKRNTA